MIQLIEVRRLIKRLRIKYIVSADYAKVPDRNILALDMWRRLILADEYLIALDNKVQLVAGVKTTVVIATGLVNLLAVMQSLAGTCMTN